jgi:hypothetical protein
VEPYLYSLYMLDPRTAQPVASGEEQLYFLFYFLFVNFISNTLCLRSLRVEVILLRGSALVAVPRKVPETLRHTAVERIPPQYGMACDSQQGLPYHVTNSM